MTTEKNLIKKYFVPLSKNLESQNLSNDAAIIKKSSDFVVTSDMMIEEVHFDSAINPKNLAKKILRVNLSDLASMGSSPYGYLLNIGMPNNLKEKWINDFCLGLSQDQKKYDLKLFGGDLSSSSKIFLSVTMLGKIKKNFLKSKSTAKSDIFVTGNLGDSALGYILNQKKNGIKLEKQIVNYFVKKHLLPSPRLDIGRRLIGYSNACRDISDGLIKDLENICDNSNLKATIFLNQIPLSRNAKKVKQNIEKNTNFWELVLCFGEDYELVFSMDKKKQNTFFEQNKKLKTKITKIGFFSEGSGVEIIDNQKNPISFQKIGFSHF